MSEEDWLVWNAADCDNSDEYLRFRSVMDSGAADHVSNRATVPHVGIRPSAGSRAGRHFTTATGGEVPNEGEQELDIVTEEGGTSSMVFQITDVKKPLCSVSKICDRGNRVVFGRSGGVIHDLRTNHLTPFSRTGRIYTMDFYVRKPVNPDTGFTRPR